MVLLPPEDHLFKQPLCTGRIYGHLCEMRLLPYYCFYCQESMCIIFAAINLSAASLPESQRAPLCLPRAVLLAEWIGSPRVVSKVISMLWLSVCKFCLSCYYWWRGRKLVAGTIKPSTDANSDFRNANPPLCAPKHGMCFPESGWGLHTPSLEASLIKVQTLFSL